MIEVDLPKRALRVAGAGVKSGATSRCRVLWDCKEGHSAAHVNPDGPAPGVRRWWRISGYSQKADVGDALSGKNPLRRGSVAHEQREIGHGRRESLQLAALGPTV